MSLTTWMAEFYLGPAGGVSREDALAHSLRKWEGLTPENLARHGVASRGGRCLTDAEDRHLSIGGLSCALCHHYAEIMLCHGCPLAAARGGVPCDKLRRDEEVSPWSSMTCEGDPQPMLAWLRAAAEAAKP